MASAKKALVTAHENIMWLHKYSVYTGSALVGVALLFAVTANAAPQPDVTNQALDTTLQSISAKLTSLENTVRQQCTGATQTSPITSSAPAACDILGANMLNVGGGFMVQDNAMGTFVISDNGQRSAVLKKLMFDVSGSYDAAGGFGPKNFKLDRADPTTGARIANTFTNGSALGNPKLESGSCTGGVSCSVGQTIPANAIVASGSVLSFDLSQLGEEIGTGSRKGYVVLADTTSIKNVSISVSAMSQMRLKGIDATGMETGVSCNANKSMMVSGKALNY